MNESNASKILGLEEDANTLEIKQAYCDLARVWHPDRFSDDPRLRQKAEETLKTINEAYQVLISHEISAIPCTGSTSESQTIEENGLPINKEELQGLGVYSIRLSVMRDGMQKLSNWGLASEDIADAIYSSPRVLDALCDGDFERAKQLISSNLLEYLAELRQSGVPEDRLWILTEAGLAIGEIAWAIRNIYGLRDGLLESDISGVKRYANTTYEFFRQHRRTRRNSRSARRALSGEEISETNIVQESWFERYSDVIKGIQIPAQNHGTIDEEAHSKLEEKAIGLSCPAVSKKDLTGAQQFLLIAAAMGVVTLFGIAANPSTHVEHRWLLGIFLIAVFLPTILFIMKSSR